MDRRHAFVLVIALAACKDKAEQKPAQKTPPRDVPAAGTAAAPDAAPRAQPSPPVTMLPAADTPEPATVESCKAVSGRTTETLTLVARRAGVDKAKAEGVAKDLTDAFVAGCGKDDWPAAFVSCIGTSPAQLESYDRCAMRLPYRITKAWDERLATTITKAGGKVAERPAAAAAEGTTFEELCGLFVAEMARLDRCVGGNMYTPGLEAIYWEGRNAAVGGLIPPDKQADLRAKCEQGATEAREETSRQCPAK